MLIIMGIVINFINIVILVKVKQSFIKFNLKIKTSKVNLEVFFIDKNTSMKYNLNMRGDEIIMAKKVFEDKIVVEMNKKLKQIDENLSIGCVSSCEDRVVSLGLSIVLKGNKDKIKQLEKLGFKKKYKEKVYNSYLGKFGNEKGYFVQKMEKPIHYDKYAIYKTPFGLRYSLYIDNYQDFKRNYILGSPHFPMIVNKRGGHCYFDEEIEKKNGFLYFKVVLENESPLTREEMFPKNSDKFFYGWIDPIGNTYTCSFENHYDCASEICEELNFEGYNPEKTLEDKGWLRISRPVPYNYENLNKRTIYSTKFEFTKKQVDIIYDLNLQDDDNVKWILKKDGFYGN